MRICKNTTYAAGSFVVKWKLADVVVKEEGDISFIRICKQFNTKKGGCIWKLHIIGKATI
ncbi:hypothetical protein D7V90_10715 [bacterium 1xD42-87]|nr:hypothetical protein D7V90_10715 [bacterium 1xD42-87]